MSLYDISQHPCHPSFFLTLQLYYTNKNVNQVNAKWKNFTSIFRSNANTFIAYYIIFFNFPLRFDCHNLFASFLNSIIMVSQSNRITFQHHCNRNHYFEKALTTSMFTYEKPSNSILLF